MAAGILESIPYPTISYIPIGSLKVHFYAILILIGITAATLIANQRLTKRGGEKWVVIDIAIMAVPFGVIGGRIFHVLTHLRDYFGSGKDPLSVLYVWEGGLAIYGALIFGAVGAYIGCRQVGIRFLSFADAVAPGILLAQAVGRLGNYFNQELFGTPTDLPWGLEVPRPNKLIPAGLPDGLLYHPTFLYEMLWNLLGVAVLLLLERRLNLRWGRLFAVYLIWYSAGRFYIEGIRIDPSEIILGLRTNQWSAIAGMLVGFGLYLYSRRRHTGFETSVLTSKGVELAAKRQSDQDSKAQTEVPADGNEGSNDAS